MAIAKQFIKAFSLTLDGSPAYTVPELIGSESDLVVIADTANITVTVVDAAAGKISVAPDPSDFNQYDFTAGQDTNWTSNPGEKAHPTSATEVQSFIDAAAQSQTNKDDIATLNGKVAVSASVSDEMSTDPTPIATGNKVVTFKNSSSEDKYSFVIPESEYAKVSVVGNDDTEGLRKRIKDSETAIGDANSGIIKDVADNAAAIGDANTGLTKTVADNTAAIGDANSGLVKAIADLAARVSSLESAVGDSTSGVVKSVADISSAIGDANSGLTKSVADNAANHSGLFDNGKIKTSLLPVATGGLPNDFFTNDGRIAEAYINKNLQNMVNELYTKGGDTFHWCFTVKNFKGKTLDLAPGDSRPEGLPNILKNLEFKISSPQDHVYFRFKSGTASGDKQAYIWSKPYGAGPSAWVKKFVMKMDEGWLPKGSGAGGVPVEYGNLNDRALNPRMNSSIQLLLENSFFVNIRYDQHTDGDDTTFTITAQRIKEIVQ